MGGTGESERDMPSEGSASVRVVDGAMGLSGMCVHVGMVMCAILRQVACCVMSWPAFLVTNTQRNT